MTNPDVWGPNPDLWLTNSDQTVLLVIFAVLAITLLIGFIDFLVNGIPKKALLQKIIMECRNCKHLIQFSVSSTTINCPNCHYCLRSDERQNLESRLKDATESYFQLAKELFGQDFIRPTISFDLKGKIFYGFAEIDGFEIFLQQFPNYKIRYNLDIGVNDPQYFIEVVVPHEVAHIVCYQVFGNKDESHGPEWRMIMRHFGVTDLRCGLEEQ